MSLKLHFVGICGRGMLPLAELANEMGFEVSGSDLNKDKLEEIRKNTSSKIKAFDFHDSKHIKDADMVIYSTALPTDHHIEIIAATSKCIPVLSRMQAINKIFKFKRQNIISICGSFGKSTTTTICASIFTNSKLNPSVYIGAQTQDFEGGIRYGQSDIAIVETCEYKGGFYEITPANILVTNIAENHLDYFCSLENEYLAFARFMAINQNEVRNIILCADDIDISFFYKYGFSGKITTYGLKKGDYQAVDIKTNHIRSSFTVKIRDTEVGLFEINMPGLKNVSNALGAIVMAHRYGISLNTIRNSLLNFGGLNRRFEVKYDSSTLAVVDDMARMPLQVTHAIEAAKTAYPSSTVIAVCGFWGSLNKRNLTDFAASLKYADISYIYEVARNGQAFGGAEDDKADKNLAKMLINIGCKATLERDTSLSDIVSQEMNSNKKAVVLLLGYDSYIKKNEMHIRKMFESFKITYNLSFYLRN